MSDKGDLCQKNYLEVRGYISGAGVDGLLRPEKAESVAARLSEGVSETRKRGRTG